MHDYFVYEQRQFYFFSSLYAFFTLFFFLIALGRTSSTVLDRNGESRQLCVVLDLRRKAFICSPLSIMLTVGF